MKRPPGRPPLDAGGTAPVYVKLSVSDYDRLDQLAKRKGGTIQDVIRKQLRPILGEQRGPA
jgi:hypothetical protein